MSSSKKVKLNSRIKENLQVPRILNLDDDFSLIKSFNEGDESVFKVLLERHKEKVRNLIYLTLGSTDDVDDIAQDIFITVYRNLKNFRYESQFTTWLYRITVNKCKDYLRKQKIRSIFSPMKEDTELSYTSNHESKDTADIIQKAIAELPNKLKMPLLMKDIQGMSYQEIAETMECEIGTVKSRIFRAREGLKEKLKPYERELLI
jgi:RNA polymerase sigma-70 factor (ECF subfamily)